MQIIYMCNKIPESGIGNTEAVKSFTVIAVLSLKRCHNAILAADEQEGQYMQMLLTFSFPALPVV